MCDQRLGPFGVIKVGLRVLKLNIIVDATSFLLAIVVCSLKHPTLISRLIKTNYIGLNLYDTVDNWSNRRGHYLQVLTHYVGYHVIE